MLTLKNKSQTEKLRMRNQGYKENLHCLNLWYVADEMGFGFVTNRNESCFSELTLGLASLQNVRRIQRRAHDAYVWDETGDSVSLFFLHFRHYACIVTV